MKRLRERIVMHRRHSKTMPAQPPQERWDISVEWTGAKAEVQTLLEFIADGGDKPYILGSGTLLCSDPPIHDICWSLKTEAAARKVFDRLLPALRLRFSPYVRARFFHDSGAKKAQIVHQYRRGKTPKMQFRKRKRAA